MTTTLSEDADRAMPAVTPAVFVDGLLREDLVCVRWQWLGGPEFGRAVVQARGGGDGRLPRVEEIDVLPPIGADVCIAGEPGGMADTEFIGRVAAHELVAGPEGEQLSAVVEHQLNDVLAGTITSSFHVGVGQGLVELPEAAIRFGPPDGLCSTHTVLHNGRMTPAFSAAADATVWTVADALAYLLATAVPSTVNAPTHAQLQLLTNFLPLDDLSITGKSVAAALQAVAELAGLSLRAARENVGLVFYRAGFDGRDANVALQPAMEPFSAEATNLWRGRIAFRRRPSRRGVLMLGERRRYELSTGMLPGWNPARHTTRWRDCVRSLSPNWAAYGDVYRKWVLNEHAWYGGSPWNLPTWTGAQVNANHFLLCQPRQFLPCLSANQANKSMGIVVEVSWPNSPWRRWRGPLWVSRDECSVYLGGDALPGEFFQAAAAGTAGVRVTACVDADARLTASLPGDGGAWIVVPAPKGQGLWRQIHNSSVFLGASGMGQPGVCDDSEVLSRLATRRQERPPDAVDADFELAWVDLGVGVGDVVDRVAGREIDLTAWADATPSVKAVTHDFLKQTTRLEVHG
ncbi:MAG: hypothetical protein FWE88_03005 [Phycisphaerae bacterium]|nr:hypothetical protein [Phycisphaerae bacterium]